MRFRDRPLHIFKSLQFRGLVGCVLVLLMLSYSEFVWAATKTTLGGFVDIVKTTLGKLKEVMSAAAYIAGVSFAIIGLLKFKAHKDNPAQIPLSTPIALIAVSAGLLFLPVVFDIAGSAVFGEAAKEHDPFAKTT